MAHSNLGIRAVGFRAFRPELFVVLITVFGLLIMLRSTLQQQQCQKPEPIFEETPPLNEEDTKPPESEAWDQNRTRSLPDLNRKCRWDTGTLIQSMRDAQRRLNKAFRANTHNATHRWETLPEFFDPIAIGFRLLLKPFKYHTRDENKYFLPFVDPTDECQLITVGVGGIYDGEAAVRRKYPQCALVGVDPSEDSRPLVEAVPGAKFIQAAVSMNGGEAISFVRRNVGYGNKVVQHRAFYELLIENTNGNTIDFMTIDTEGAEFTLLRTLHTQRDLFAKVCQFNVELHWAEEHYGVSIDEFDRLLGEILDEAHFVLLNADHRMSTLRQLFFLNVGDRECIQKFLC